MELKALKSRVEQLERCVQSQYLEIARLSTILQQNNLTSTDHFHQNQNGHRSMGPLIQTNYSNANTNNITPVRQDVNIVYRNSSAPTFRPYDMNPIVHPSSAIPPIGCKPTLNFINPVAEKERACSNTNSIGLNSSSNSRFCLQPIALPPPSSKRITVPPQHGRFDFGLDTDEDSADDSPDDSRHSRQRQSFVERPNGDEDLRVNTPLGGAENKDPTHEISMNVCSGNDEYRNVVTETMSTVQNRECQAIDKSKTITITIQRSNSVVSSTSDKSEQLVCKNNENPRVETSKDSFNTKNHDQSNVKKSQDQQLSSHKSNNNEIMFVSYTDPADLTENGLCEYPIGKIIEKSKLPTNDKSEIHEAPYVNYKFRRIQRSSDEILKENEQNNWPYPPTVPKPKIPEKLKIILNRSPFQ